MQDGDARGKRIDISDFKGAGDGGTTEQVRKTPSVVLSMNAHSARGRPWISSIYMS
jgi:hypothetical protein